MVEKIMDGKITDQTKRIYQLSIQLSLESQHRVPSNKIVKDLREHIEELERLMQARDIKTIFTQSSLDN